MATSVAQLLLQDTAATGNARHTPCKRHLVMAIMVAMANLMLASAGKLGAGAAGPEGFQLIWPTVQAIRDSVEGWRGGASVPGPAKNVNKPFLQPYWHKCAFLCAILHALASQLLLMLTYGITDVSLAT